jgi:predicted transcriptional regulator
MGSVLTDVEGERGVPKMATAHESPKSRMIAIIEDQPDDSSYDEILRELAMARMVERGLADSDAGRTISSEEMARRMRSWPK